LENKGQLAFDDNDKTVNNNDNKNKKQASSPEEQIRQSSISSKKLLLTNSPQTNERASFSLEATFDQERQLSKSKNRIVQQEEGNNNDDDGSSDEIVYSCALSEEIVNENESSSNSSMDDNELSDEEENSLPLDDDDDDSVLKSDTSKSNSQRGASDFQQIESTNDESRRKAFLSVDSGHVASDSPSDLSPSTSPSWKKHTLSNITLKPTFPCLKCGSSTYGEDVISVEKHYFHKHCIICTICGKILKEKEYTLFDKANDGTIQFYCTLDFCKRRLKQVQTNIAANIQSEKQRHRLSDLPRLYPDLSYDNRDNNETKNRRNTTTLTTPPSSTTSAVPQQSLTSWANSFRLYPSLTDALSKKSHPLNVVKLPYADDDEEHTNGHEKPSSDTIIGWKTELFDDSTAKLTQNLAATTLNKTTDSKQRFKKRARNRPHTPPMPDTFTNETQHSLTIEKDLNQNYDLSNMTNLSSNIDNLSTYLKRNDLKENSPMTTSINRKKKPLLLSPSVTRSSSSSSHRSSSIDLLNMTERQKKRLEEKRQRDLRQQELKRLRVSQEIQRELDEIDVKKVELENQHADVQESLAICDKNKQSYWEGEYLRIVQEKHALQRLEDEYIIAQKALTLTNEQSRTQQELRRLYSVPAEQKTTDDKQREEQLLAKNTELVSERDRLTNEIDQIRLRELEEDQQITKAYQLHGVHPIPKLISGALDILKDIV
ncbi:unnamed protein product, partial [Didymodactylos carnosus]